MFNLAGIHFSPSPFVAESNRRIFSMEEKGYCVKCRKESDMVEANQVTMKNGRPAVKGKCGKCGTGMYKILPKKK
jgi:hypothetical protein